MALYCIPWSLFLAALVLSGFVQSRVADDFCRRRGCDDNRCPNQTRPVAAPLRSSLVSTVEQAIDLAANGRCQEALPVLKESRGTYFGQRPEVPCRDGHSALCHESRPSGDCGHSSLFPKSRVSSRSRSPLYHYALLRRACLARFARARSDCAFFLSGARSRKPKRWRSQEQVGRCRRRIQEDPPRQNPNVPGIHFRLGRVALSKNGSPANTYEAKREFEEELKIDPSNASAEFSLGEIARRASQWDEAISRFTNASKLDSEFAEAFLALGMSLNSAERYSEASSPTRTLYENAACRSRWPLPALDRLRAYGPKRGRRSRDGYPAANYRKNAEWEDTSLDDTPSRRYENLNAKNQTRWNQMPSRRRVLQMLGWAGLGSTLGRMDSTISTLAANDTAPAFEEIPPAASGISWSSCERSVARNVHAGNCPDLAVHSLDYDNATAGWTFIS